MIRGKIYILMISLLIISNFLIAGENHHYYIKIKDKIPILNELFKMGSDVNPRGDSIQITSNNLLYNGQSVLPVMGEFHYARFEDTEWRKELLKMKAGGINIISTYVFWIYHEEEEGIYNWDGKRNLQKFLEICKEIDLSVILRLGPWCHGEVRNGGFPEWLIKNGIKLREDNPAYLKNVKNWFSQIYKQTKGLLWKDGGTVIGIQIENEYRGQGTHLMTLKRMAQEIGFDVPIYTRTGWPKLATPVPYGEIIPLYGDYADGFWDRSTEEMPGDYGKSYLFRSFRNSTVIATEQLPKQANNDNENDIGYPYFTCELGGGMMPSYHRRISINPMDVYAMTLVRIGSGSNMPGYYMYHGGNNPDGKLTALNEEQTSNYTNYNDLPLKSYDFQAPLGEFGQVNPHYHLLRKLHLFLHDFGGDLVLMKPYFPENAEKDFKKDSLLRWAVRSNGKSGYVFVNNYHRLKTLSEKKGVQFTFDLPKEQITLPQEPIDIPAGASFFIPFNINLEDANLLYATAQPIAKIEEKGNLTFVFTQIKGIPSEFVFDKKNIKVKSSVVKFKTKNNRFIFSDLSAGTNEAVLLQSQKGKTITIVLLDDKTSLEMYKEELAGKERLFITNSVLMCNKNQLELENSDNEFNMSVFPPLETVSLGGKELKPIKNGIFSKYEINLKEKKFPKIELIKTEDVKFPLPEIKMGQKGVAQMPNDSDFAKAAVWKIKLPDDFKKNDIILRISYKGDVARIYSGSELLTDNFYNGKSFDVDLNYFGNKIFDNELKLMILPLQKNAPIYLPKNVVSFLKNENYVIKAPLIKMIEKRRVSLIVQ